MPDVLVHAAAGHPGARDDEIASFNDYVGGCGNLLVMLQGGTLDHKDTVKNLTLFSRELLPRIQNLGLSATAAMEAIEAARREAQKGNPGTAKRSRPQ